jgi:CHAT domain-containing protein/tetratricopeptide (TPR) repeat protein
LSAPSVPVEKRHDSPRFWTKSVAIPRWIPVSIAVIALIATLTWRRDGRGQLASVESLLAQAYTKDRPMAMRIPRARYVALVHEKGAAETSRRVQRSARPPELIQAEGIISRQLEDHPGDHEWLLVQGRAYLLEGDYEASITIFRQILDSYPTSTSALTDMASAYFERNRAGDSGMAVELLGRALAKQPDDPIIIFNRAVACERAELYVQAVDDWEHYLKIDPQGPWADEARENLQRLKEKPQKTKEHSLLLPEEFNLEIEQDYPASSVRNVDPPESYLTVAIAEWLPLAFAPVKTARSGEAKKAVLTLGRLLREINGDNWIDSLVAKTQSRSFSRAVKALSLAVRANSVGDFSSGVRHAQTAQRLFRLDTNDAGESRALIEEIYSLHLSDRANDCLTKVPDLSSRLVGHAYRWVEIQLLLEHGVCRNMTGDIGSAERLFSAAWQKSDASGYASLAMRAAGFLAFIYWEEGRLQEAWQQSQSGLLVFWSRSLEPMTGYNLYSCMDLIADSEEKPYLDLAITKQALSLLSNSSDLLLIAEEHQRLARAALRVRDVGLAESHFADASRLLTLAPRTEATENYRIAADIETARLEAQQGRPIVALERLRVVYPHLKRISNRYVTAGYYQLYGDLQTRLGHLQEAETALRLAIDIAEKELASLHSTQERMSWARHTAPVYESMAELQLRQKDDAGALKTLEWHRGATSRPLARRVYRGKEVADELSQPTQLNEARSSSRGGQSEVVLVYALVQGDLVIWVHDASGILARRVEDATANIRDLAARFQEACANPTSSLAVTQGLARRLYELLILPIADRLPDKATVFVETDDTLAAVPFQALIDRNNHYLNERNSIVYIPSIQTFHALHAKASDLNAGLRALVVASVDGDSSRRLPPLIDSEREAERVVSKFPKSRFLRGQDLSIQRLRREVASVEVFHFSGHTTKEIGRPALVLDNGLELLDSAALSSMDLKALRLAVLSACATEAGNAGTVRDWESLARIYVRAGVPHVVASRWNVESRSSELLMNYFYDSVLSGQSVGQALSVAELKLRRDPKFAHPYYWAGFDAFGLN